MSAGKLTGKVAVVTGASSGIGRECAKALAAEGAKVALAARNVELLATLKGEIETAGGKCISVPTDVVDRAQMKALAGAVTEQLGPPDILVNNAGVMYFTMMASCKEDKWDQMVDVICKGFLNGVGAFLPGMLERGAGHIVTVTSDAGRKCFPGLSVYSGTKAFVEFTSQGLRLENASKGLKVTTIQPGNVETNLLKNCPVEEEEGLDAYSTPSGAKVLDPVDVANALVYAVSQPPHVAVNEILVEPREEPC